MPSFFTLGVNHNRLGLDDEGLISNPTAIRVFEISLPLLASSSRFLQEKFGFWLVKIFRELQIFGSGLRIQVLPNVQKRRKLYLKLPLSDILT